MTRLARYAVGVGVLALVAFVLGTRWFEATKCGGPDFGGECDLAALTGIAWAVVAVAAALVLIVTVEIVRVVRRRRARAGASR